MQAESFKFDPLGQGQFLAVVDGARGPPHVLLPGVAAALASAARRLLAT